MKWLIQLMHGANMKIAEEDIWVHEAGGWEKMLKIV
jgi:hypothetical protein